MREKSRDVETSILIAPIASPGLQDPGNRGRKFGDMNFWRAAHFWSDQMLDLETQNFLGSFLD